MHKDTLIKKKRSINLGGKLLDLSTPRIMGILNITPDSFYDGGLYQQPDTIKKRVNELLTEGADIIDVGAYSSRPNAEDIDFETEWNRLAGALEIIRNSFPDIPLSIDTFRANVARKAVTGFGVQMVNDISAGMLDAAMHETIAELQVPYLIMHMPGNPATMQQHTRYSDVTREVIEFLGRQTQKLKSLGVNDILVDPGFGFGKTLDQNYRLLYQLDLFGILDLPLVVGISRKSMTYRLLNTKPVEALNGTTALHMLALERGADILRVHDVREARETVILFNKARQEGLK